MPLQQSTGTCCQSPPISMVYLLVGAALIKIGVLLMNGPSMFRDSGIYVAYADAILDHGRAFAPLAVVQRLPHLSCFVSPVIHSCSRVRSSSLRPTTRSSP